VAQFSKEWAAGIARPISFWYGDEEALAHAAIESRHVRALEQQN
jgi:hypothetical protein